MTEKLRGLKSFDEIRAENHSTRNVLKALLGDGRMSGGLEDFAVWLMAHDYLAVAWHGKDLTEATIAKLQKQLARQLVDDYRDDSARMTQEED